jgi:hypothetical protein
MGSRRESTGKYWNFSPVSGLKGRMQLTELEEIAPEKSAQNARKQKENGTFGNGSLDRMHRITVRCKLPRVSGATPELWPGKILLRGEAAQLSMWHGRPGLQVARGTSWAGCPCHGTPRRRPSHLPLRAFALPLLSLLPLPQLHIPRHVTVGLLSSSSPRLCAFALPLPFSSSPPAEALLSSPSSHPVRKELAGRTPQPGQQLTKRRTPPAGVWLHFSGGASRAPVSGACCAVGQLLRRKGTEAQRTATDSPEKRHLHPMHPPTGKSLLSPSLRLSVSALLVPRELSSVTFLLFQAGAAGFSPRKESATALRKIVDRGSRFW